MKAINIGHLAAADIKKLPDNTVMISINEEHVPLHNLQLDRTSRRILTLQFSDVTVPTVVKGNVHNPISEVIAYQIIEFIDDHDDKDFIVHCHAGVSRSAAICLYLNMIYGHTLKPNFWKLSNPNKYVLGTLMLCNWK